MDYDKLIDRLNTKLQAYSAYTDSGLAHVMEDAITAIETLRADLARVTAERDAAVECIYKIEDDLDRGNDNDWAREHISEWERQKED